MHVQAVLSVNASNTADPHAGDADSPWHYVGAVHQGQSNAASGVYLGNGWVLTAGHVGAGTFSLGGSDYLYDGVSASSIGTADMIVFRLTASPVLPALTLASTTPAFGSTVEFHGSGRIRGSEEITYSTVPLRQGFDWSVAPAKGWGTNTVGSFGVSLIGSTSAFSTTFQQVGLPDEAQATLGDSGGGLFVETAEGWELAGMMFAISNVTSHPPDSAVYGDLTYAADIATYRQQLLDLTSVPEPATASLCLSGALLLGAFRRRRL